MDEKSFGSPGLLAMTEDVLAKFLSVNSSLIVKLF